MLKRIVLVVTFCWGLPYSVAAGPIVTWEAFGLTNFAINRFPPAPDPLPPGPPPPPQAPPVGTPWSLSISFDPDAAFHTVLSSPTSPCNTVGISGSFTLGDTSYTYGGGSNQAFSNAGLLGPTSLLGYTCIDMAIGKFDFFLFPVPTADDPYQLFWGHMYLLATYRDAVIDGSFPDAPTVVQAGTFLFNNESYQFGGTFAPQAAGVEQPTPVPEPGTMALLGVGLAWAGRRRWRERKAN